MLDDIRLRAFLAMPDVACPEFTAGEVWYAQLLRLFGFYEHVVAGSAPVNTLSEIIHREHLYTD